MATEPIPYPHANDTTSDAKHLPELEMIKILGSYETSHSLTNTTELFLVVGNYHVVISSHDTREAAVVALNAIDIENSDFANAKLVAPGETVSGSLSCSLTRQMTADEEMEAMRESAAFFGLSCE